MQCNGAANKKKNEYIIKKVDYIVADVNHFKAAVDRKEFISNDDDQDTAITVVVLKKKLIDVEATQDPVISDIESIYMATVSQQQQVDRFRKKLSTYSQAVNELNVKVSQVFHKCFQHHTLRPENPTFKQPDVSSAAYTTFLKLDVLKVDFN